jgi:hypothetical protein
MIGMMRLRRTALAISVAGLLLPCLGCDGYTRVHGTIRDASGFPVAGAIVVFNPKGSTYPKQTKSLADGTYTVGSTHAPFLHVPLTLVVSKEGYTTVGQEFNSTREHVRLMDVVLLPEDSGAEKSQQSSTSK